MSLAACRFPRGRVQSKCIHLLIFKRGHVHCAWDSCLHQAVDKHELSIAPLPFYKLDKTGHHLSHGRDAGRPCQKQVRTDGRKRPPPSATHHSPPARETTLLYHNGSAAPGAPGKSRSDLETRAVDCSGRRRSCGGIARDFACFGNTSPEQGLLNSRFLKQRWT